jgi:signal transduction histidine kinase
VRDRQGTPLHLVFQIEDITKQQAIEQLKRDFISIVSHEIRTPLTAIHGSLGLLAHGLYNNRPDKMQQMLQIAASQTDRLVRLVNDILSLERLESGQVVMPKQICEVAPLMQQAVETMQAMAEQKHIKLRLIPLNAKVWGNSDAVIQTLMNLISNAIKFSPPHTTVTVQARQVETEDPIQTKHKMQELLPADAASLSSFAYVLFSVSDQGRGIPPEKLDIIFEQFQQVDASDCREKGGTGLGLAICRSIVQRHSGHIWVDSTLGQGSTFYFTLPLSWAKFSMLEE